MIKKTRVCLGLAAAAIVSLVAACSSGGDADPNTITFSGQTSEQGIWQPLFEAFEKANPGVKIDAQYTPNDSYPQLIQTRLQAGHAADVIQTTPGTGGGLAALTLAAGGQVADLSANSWAASLPDSTKKLVTLNGKIYGYPTDLAPFFVAYNPEMFSKAGVSVPTTFAELTAACTKLAATGVTPISLAGASFQNVSILVQTIAANDVFGPDPDWNTERADKKTTFASSPSWQKVISDIQKMKDAKCFSTDVAGVKAPVHIQRFATGQAAMQVMPAQAIVQVRAAAPKSFQFSSFAFPADTAAQTKVSAGSGIALVVNAKAGNPALAQKLIDFLGQPAQRATYAQTAGTIAPGAAADGSDVYTDVLTPLKPYLTADKALTLNYLAWPTANVAQQLATSAQGLFTGQKSAEQVLGDADQAWDGASR
ncbi:raffinose/stachyose/melibiose transport system substrate-binding protein [Amycolatopsis bartoniae]|uniref:ABC transporter substrate-binding protein n=1 Tax=Amycolatopsis bartoniae TaxID=941986 RepID=A0A8H9IS31_9PSEU|nr:ABC transporter substrate-binding protein [Amycolatopsis bartoniae]MBB2938376.1 raffinose/stachyose/melibiose transport system substrate-binding protein [Amycolatopsis bartoniae]TVT10220.1 carbohydrate ABC transporter substrate-binding protein [Amycolatopsis bartoniae]GHF34734.1 ABC transporter substrate-binding protein [Amycolatopsis bartoniae]